MKNNDIVKSQDTTYRIIDIAGDKAFVIDCNKKSVPKWINFNLISPHCTDGIRELPDINELDVLSRKIAYERFSYLAIYNR